MLKHLLLAAASVALLLNIASAAPVFTFFDAGAKGTNPTSLNDGGAIVGSAVDDANNVTCFFRNPHGVITIVNPAPNSILSQCQSLNVHGVAVGTYQTLEQVQTHGFMRLHQGQIVILDEPNATRGTQVSGINSRGAVTGDYYDPVKNRGFLRRADGTYREFDFPGMAQTVPHLINDSGTIVGQGFEAGNTTTPAAFIRTSNGRFTKIRIPGSQKGIAPSAINANDDIAGLFNDNTHVSHAFVRLADGTVTIIDAPNAGTDHFQGTSFIGMNDFGDAVGTVVDSNGVSHGFVRLRTGAVSQIDAPGAGTKEGMGTRLCCINNAGKIAGTYTAKGKISHAFVVVP